MKIIGAIQECSGLMVNVKLSSGKTEWLRPPEGGLTREEAERLIEEQGVKVECR